MSLFSSIGSALSSGFKSITGAASSILKPISKIPLIGDIASAGMSFLGGNMANSANAENALNQMDFQERMSNTSYQRSMQDMAAAGLNPILAYKQGGASSPSGTMANASDPVTPAINTGLASRLQTNQVNNLKKQNQILAEQKRSAFHAANIAKYDQLYKNLMKDMVWPHEVSAAKAQAINDKKRATKEGIILDYELKHPNLLKTERVLRPSQSLTHSAKSIRDMIKSNPAPIYNTSKIFLRH